MSNIKDLQDKNWIWRIVRIVRICVKDAHQLQLSFLHYMATDQKELDKGKDMSQSSVPSNHYRSTVPESLHAVQSELPDDVVELNIRLEGHQAYFDNQVSPAEGNPSWTVEPPHLNTTIHNAIVLSQVISKPNSAKISHEALNPYAYRQIGNAGSLDDVARLLRAPKNWLEIYSSIIFTNADVRIRFRNFQGLPPDASEVTVQQQFDYLVRQMAESLGLQNLKTQREAKCMVGGLLARPQYTVRGAMDPRFADCTGLHLLATEIKTAQSFPSGDMWYRKSRGIQVLSTLYASACPTFLLTQQCWKLFVENDERTEVLTFPYGGEETDTPHMKSTLLSLVGPDLVQAITICLLSERHRPLEEAKRPLSIDLSNPFPVAGSSLHRAGDSPTDESTKKPKVESKEPRFKSGSANGEPVYTVVHILPDDVVAAIERDILAEELEKYKAALKGKEEFVQSKSDLTLVDL